MKTQVDECNGDLSPVVPQLLPDVLKKLLPPGHRARKKDNLTRNRFSHLRLLAELTVAALRRL